MKSIYLVIINTGEWLPFGFQMPKLVIAPDFFPFIKSQYLLPIYVLLYNSWEENLEYSLDTDSMSNMYYNTSHKNKGCFRGT